MGMQGRESEGEMMGDEKGKGGEMRISWDINICITTLETFLLSPSLS